MLNKYLETKIAALILILYLIFQLLNFNFGILLSGLLIVSVMPGYLINNILKFDYRMNILSKIGLAISSSLVTVTFFLLLLGNHLVFSKNFFIFSVVTLNCLLLFLKIMSDRFFARKNSSEVAPQIKTNWFYIILGLIPFILFITRIIISPYLTDMDGALYVREMTAIENLKIDVSFLNSDRPGFSRLIMAFRFLTDSSLTNLFKYILPGLGWLSFLSLFSFFNVQKHTNKATNSILYLLLLISPSLVGHLDRFKPESIIFILAIPAIMIYIKAYQNKNILHYCLGLVYCMSMIKIHQTGAIFFLAYLFGGLIFIISNRNFYAKYLNIRNLLMFSVIIFPYLIIFNVKRLLILPINLYHLFANDMHLQFRWWFLNNYQSAGAELSWPGWQFILFYAFNGIFVVILSFILLKRKDLRDNKINFALLPVILLLSIYIIISEILPRIGVYILPDRAWNHVFLYSVIITILISIFSDRAYKLLNNRLILLTLFTNLALAIIVMDIVTMSAGATISRSEMPAVNSINKNTPSDSIILSTQVYNQMLIENFTNRLFFYVSPDNFSCYENKSISVKDLSTCTLDDVKQNKISLVVNNFATKTVTVTERTTLRRDDGNPGYDTLNVLNQNTEKILLSSKDLSNRPIYIYYSYAKDDGLMSKFNRQYWIRGIDSSHRDFYKNIEGEKIFNDQSGTLIRIQ